MFFFFALLFSKGPKRPREGSSTTTTHHAPSNNSASLCVTDHTLLLCQEEQWLPVTTLDGRTDTSSCERTSVTCDLLRTHLPTAADVLLVCL
jgi:hypothetical protein